MPISRQLFGIRASFRAIVRTAPRTSVQASQARYATQDYGSGEGNPVGERPEKQGPNPSEHLEHPGPPPPDVGQNKSESSGSNKQPSSSKSSSSGSEPAGNDTAKNAGQSEKANQAVKGKQPKILSDNPPAEQDESVRKHNEEMDQRADRASAGVSNEDAGNDKVPPSFWSGNTGDPKEK